MGGGMGGAFDFDPDSVSYTTVILGIACVALLMSTVYFYNQVLDLESGAGNGSVVAACTSRCCFSDTVFDSGYNKCVAKIQACKEGQARQNGTCVPISEIEEEAAKRAAKKVKGPQGAAIGLSVLAAVILVYAYVLPSREDFDYIRDRAGRVVKVLREDFDETVGAGAAGTAGTVGEAPTVGDDPEDTEEATAPTVPPEPQVDASAAPSAPPAPPEPQAEDSLI